jgi:hypothetical protein
VKGWERFILEHGWRAHAYELAVVVEQPAAEIERVRSTGACRRLTAGKRFANLFALWHGRPPRDDEWPAPRRHHGTYEWQAREDALLVSLVGRLGKMQISTVLTERLRKVTGDRRAARVPHAISSRVRRFGLQFSDVVGGIKLVDAAREIGTYAAVFQAIERKALAAFRVGRIWVIPYDAWTKWKAQHVFPPKGYVQLSKLKRPLSIHSDKLSEFARAGWIPTAVRCNPYGMRAKITKFGTWFVDPKVARKLVADRRAGRPMPWHGQPEPGNLRVTFKLWTERKHPQACTTCRQIWGRRGAPRTYDDYILRYPPLAHGAKRHLTRRWSPGLTLKVVAKLTGRSWGGVRNAVRNGLLRATRMGTTYYVTRTDATRWKARKCPAGGDPKSWLSIEAASGLYSFTLRELRGYIRVGKLRSKVGTSGAARGITYVLKQQCAELRECMGFSEEEAARRVGVTVARFRKLLEGVDWRGAKGIPLATVQAVVKRLDSREGYTLDEAAEGLRTTRSWLKERIADGTIRLLRAKWDRRRLYVSEPMMKRLREFKRTRRSTEALGSNWLFLSEAAREAGVCTTTILRWREDRLLKRRPSHLGFRYHRRAVRAQARRYWKSARFLRPVKPAWLTASNDDQARAAA